MTREEHRSAGGAARLRVLWLIKSLKAGGAERILVNCARARDADRYSYEAAYLLAGEDDLLPELQAAGVPVTCLSAGRPYDLRWAWRLRTMLRRDPYDVLHVHSPYAAAFARLAVATVPAPVRPALVYTEHSGWSSHARATRIANRATYGRNDATFAVSEHVRSSLSPRWSAQVRTLVHGVDLAAVEAQRRHRAGVRAELGVGDDEVLIGTVANLRPEKGYPDLLRAAALLSPGRAVRFVALGQGPLEARLRHLHGELRLGETFRFLGYRQDALRVMSGFDLFVLASHREGLPVVVMEALAMGVPVVCTAVGGIPEAVTDGTEGLLVPPGQPEKLAEALAALAADATRRIRMGEAAAARGAGFDIRLAMRELEATYREMSTVPRGSNGAGGRGRSSGRTGGAGAVAVRSRFRG